MIECTVMVVEILVEDMAAVMDMAEDMAMEDAEADSVQALR